MIGPFSLGALQRSSRGPVLRSRCSCGLSFLGNFATRGKRCDVGRKPIEVDVDNGGREEGKGLADEQTTHHRVAKWLTDLGPCAGADHQGYATQEGSCC